MEVLVAVEYETIDGSDVLKKVAGVFTSYPNFRIWADAHPQTQWVLWKMPLNDGTGEWVLS